MAQAHDIDFGRMYDSGVLTAAQQFVQIWCKRHRRYEWHWVPTGGPLSPDAERTQPPPPFA